MHAGMFHDTAYLPTYPYRHQFRRAAIPSLMEEENPGKKEEGRGSNERTL